MYTQYDKAIAGLLTSLLGVLAMFQLPVGWITPEVIGAVTPFLTMLIVFLVPNVKPDEITPPTSDSQQ